MNSYKQKKDWREKFDENFPPPKLEGYTTATEAMILEKEKVVHEAVKQFISSLIYETEKQAQSDMREDLIKWAEDRKLEDIEERMETVLDLQSYDQCLDDLISYLNKSK